MTSKQRKAIERAARVAAANAKRQRDAHDALVAAFPTYFAHDGGAIMASAKATDAAASAARVLGSMVQA